MSVEKALQVWEDMFGMGDGQGMGGTDPEERARVEAEEREQPREKCLMALEDRHRVHADVVEDGAAARDAVEALRIIRVRSAAAFDEWEWLRDMCYRTHVEHDRLWSRYRTAMRRAEME